MITEVRRLAEGDDLGTVSRLIYETDNCILPHLFKDSQTSAKEILPYMIQSDTIYNKNNIFVAIMDEKIVGIMIVNHAPVKIDVSAYFDAFESAGATIDESFATVLKEYFLLLEDQPNGYFIPNICIEQAYRGQGIGSEMLDTILPTLDSSSDVYLECMADNERALAMYEGHGFEILFKYDGFTGVPYYKMIRRANRDTIVYDTIAQNEETQA